MGAQLPRAGLALRPASVDSGTQPRSLDPTMSSYHGSRQMSHPQTEHTRNLLLLLSWAVSGTEVFALLKAF